jgi:hypothetical protein
VAGNGAALGKAVLLVIDSESEEDYLDSNDWMLVTADAALLQQPVFQEGDVRSLRGRPGFRDWTDDYSNLFKILR